MSKNHPGPNCAGAPRDYVGKHAQGIVDTDTGSNVAGAVSVGGSTGLPAGFQILSDEFGAVLLDELGNLLIAE